MTDDEIRLECLKLAERVAGPEVAAVLKAAQAFADFALGNSAPSRISAVGAQYLSNGCRASTPRRDPA